jgi:C1A family cysteine protease
MTFLNADTNAYIYTGTEERNHSVNIVGWDDDFPKEKFVPEAPGNGAFITRNSYGSAWGDDGYFYVSYYDVLIGQKNAVFLGAEPPGKESAVYQYDELGATASAGFGSETACAANVFTASSDEVLKAVSFLRRFHKLRLMK